MINYKLICNLNNYLDKKRNKQIFIKKEKSTGTELARIKPIAGFTDFVKEQAAVAVDFVKDKFLLIE